MSAHDGRPNIVFIYADQLSFRAAGPYGNDCVRTPTLDRMANDGVVFDRFYANSAVCGPSRHATYTGLMPFAHPHWAQPNCIGSPHLSYMGDWFREDG